MLGFMIVTAFISMWITNTATTAMMTPIMEAVLKQLDEELEIETKGGNKKAASEETVTGDEEASRPLSRSSEAGHFEVDSGDRELIEMASAIHEPETNNVPSVSRYKFLFSSEVFDFLEFFSGDKVESEL